MVGQPRVPAQLDAAALGQALDGVLREPPFAELIPPTLGERIWRWVDQAWSQLSWPLAPVLLARSWLFWLLAASLLGVLAAALLARRRWPRRRRSNAALTGELDSSAERALAPSSLALARGAWARGDARGAIERLWQSVAALNPGANQSSLTPRQNVRLLRAHVSPELYQQLEQVLWAHERACYAGQSPELSEVSVLLEALTPLLEGRARPGFAEHVSR
jgi:hypothetical protein